MRKNRIITLLIPLIFAYCEGGFERFVPPSNSISGRGPKRAPKVLSTTPTDGATVSPVTTSSGTQIRVVFDMSMKQTQQPFINTYVRDIGQSNENIWYSIANSGATFTWSSTNVGDDTVTIQLGWVRWPENNVIGFDFNNSLLKNLDDLTLEHSTKISFTVGFDPGRYKVVQTNQDACYFYSDGFNDRWEEILNCGGAGATGSNGEKVGSYHFPAGQNGFIDPKNTYYGPTFYGSAGGSINGRRFIRNSNPQNIVIASATQCTGSSSNVGCEPYTVDPVTNLVWKTCSQGQNYADVSVVGAGDKCVNSGNDYTWGDAVNACASMNTANNGQGYGGRKDWRLPTAQELENLVDYGIKYNFGLPEPSAGYAEGPAMDGYLEGSYNHQGAFPNTLITKGYWTATGISAKFQGSIQYANSLVVEFKKGTIGSGSAGSLLDSRRITTNRQKVRCVAGPTVAASTPSLAVSSVQTSGSGSQIPLTTTWGTFVGNDSNATFNVISAVASYDVQANQYYVTATFNKNVDTTSGGTPANYCFATAAGTCPASVLSITTVSATGNTVRIATGAQTAGTAYKLIITGPVTSDVASGSVAITPVNRTLFTAYPASTFDVASALSTSTTTIQVTFNKLPTESEATNAANYCINTVAATTCGASAPAISSVSLSGYTATITTASALNPGTGYSIFASNIRYLGAQLVTDNNNKLQWRRCRLGTFDNSTCSDDGVATNDSMQWNQGLNSCDELNRENYGVVSGGTVTDRFRWRAPTVNELKSIADRTLFPTLGYAIDQTIFPSPNVLAEDYGSSTNRAFNGDPNWAGPEGQPAFNLFWTVNYIVGFPSINQKDNNDIMPLGLKPPRKHYRCVRSMP